MPRRSASPGITVGGKAAGFPGGAAGAAANGPTCGTWGTGATAPTEGGAGTPGGTKPPVGAASISGTDGGATPAEGIDCPGPAEKKALASWAINLASGAPAKPAGG